MLVTRRGRDEVEHATVADLPRFLAPGDTLVFNTTAVAPARLVGRRVPGGGRVEGLFVRETPPDRWVVMLQGRGRLRAGDRIELLDLDDRPAGSHLELLERDGEGWSVRAPVAAAALEGLDRAGRTPLPPYIRRARGVSAVADALDRAWYQTVYADHSARRSVAAPTAGLHFTPRLLEALRRAGVARVDVILDVGPGTFRPGTAPTLAEHVMHAEHFAVAPEALRALEAAGSGSPRRGRIIAVGTTVVRTLESLPDPLPAPGPGGRPLCGTTTLLIAPPWEFRRVDGLLTNFHLPRSTLLALVAAMLGLERVLDLYREAVRLGYRFYSYGDAMLILP